ncbi:MAG: hypothetical protein NTV94_13345 [Planctomycetota bacterium]|nr:hypothetical protein [Planctomycetota bacterium]
MKKNLSILVAAASCAGLSAAAFAQTPCPLPDNCVTNPSFEQLDVFSSQRDPIGWHNLSNPNESKRRVLGDAFLPPAVARTGTASISISTPGASEFRGMTCDWRNFSISGFPFFDPVFDYAGGDIVVSGWYYIPTSAPITGDSAFIKLNIKRGNQDYATFDPIGRGVSNLLIQGHTNNQWRRYELRWTRADIENELTFNQDQGYFAMPPYPNHLKIVLSRFGFGNVPSSGTIFWDDITMIQEPAASACGCAADYNADGGVDGGDIEGFFTDWEAGVGCSDVNQDGGIDGGDIEAFFLLWEAGGC